MALSVSLLSGCVVSGELITRQIQEDAQRRRERAVPPSPTPTSTSLPATVTPTPTRTPRPGRTLASVIRVWDGNTILIEGGYSVRYIGVNAPGAGMFRRPLEPFGREAAERNVELVEGKQVELEEDVTDVDSAGNLLRYVYVGDVMVNEALLREGLARLAPFGPNRRYAGMLNLAEAEARQTPLNIWTLITPTPTPTREPTDTPLPSPTPGPTATPLPTRPGVPQSTAIIRVPTPIPTATGTEDL